MKYKIFGKSGLRVSELALGTLTFGDHWGWGTDKEEARRVFDAYIEAGGNFIDTANNYANGQSEEFVGEFIQQDREKLVVTTKYSCSMNPDDPNAGGNHRKNMIQSLDASLKRLQTDYIDIFWLHAWDFFTPVEEIMRALDDQVRAGKVMYVGISDVPAWVVSQANTLADLRGWSPFIGLQVEYSLIQREVERDLLPMARNLDISVTAWSPLGGGILTGKYKGTEAEDSKRAGYNAGRINERIQLIVEAVKKVAQEVERTPAQVALAWMRQQEGNPIAIIGARKMPQFQDNLDSLTLELSDAQLALLNEVSKIDLGFPHDFIQSDIVRSVINGNHANNIYTHRHYI